MPVPILSYLRVYEPLRVFEGPSGAQVREALARGPIDAVTAGGLEREQCLVAILRGRLLPAPRSEVLVTTGPGGERLVCPLDTRPRAGAALVAFLDGSPAALATAAVPVDARAARKLAEKAIAELGDRAAHVVSASWTVPLPWFALVEQEARQVAHDPRRVWWQVPIAQARERAELAESVVRETLGESLTGAGPAEVLAETCAWLERFDDEAVVELDYGGLVELMGDDELDADRSAADVAAALDALREGEAEPAAAAYQRLQEFWAVLAARERSC